VVRTLLPAIGRYAARAVVARDAGAANKAFLASAGLLLTAAAYGARSLGARARALRP
jgi:hypothetical protein